MTATDLVWTRQREAAGTIKKRTPTHTHPHPHTDATMQSEPNDGADKRECR